MSRARLMAMMLGGVLALSERNNPPTVSFSRPRSSVWEPWPATSTPTPPAAAQAPFEECQHYEHGPCAQHRGVHFRAIRFGDKEWNAITGWHDIARGP